MAELEPDRTRRGHWPAPPMDNDDILSEIILRLPPRPSSLPRVSLVCKRWRGLVSDPVFRRRRRELHRKPPLLGVFHNTDLGLPHRFVPVGDLPDRVPAARVPLPFPNPSSWRFLDCRHGRALLFNRVRRELLVWDPMAASRICFPLPLNALRDCIGTVLSDHTRGGDGEPDPFKVVLIWRKSTQQLRRKIVLVFSSKSMVWGNLICEDCEFNYPIYVRGMKPGILVGSAMYWLLLDDFIVEFDLATQNLAEIRAPSAARSTCWQSQLVVTENDRLGLAFVSGLTIQMWRMVCCVDSVAEWVLQRIIGLNEFLPPILGMQRKLQYFLGFDEDNNAIFILTDVGVFMVHLELLQSKMICQGDLHFEIYPYTSFFPADGVAAQANDVEPLGSGASEAINRMNMEGISMWHYIDPQGDVQGPFSMVLLRRWKESGFFNEDFRVWRTDQTKEQAILLTDICS